MSKKSAWKTIALPADMVKRVRRILARAGYRSLAEFVRDACRRRLEELGGEGD
jgi:metal-responsive CopG/Arc/MetJ family transcriptional regulator